MIAGTAATPPGPPTTSDFIEVYPNALSAEFCRAIIDRFAASGQDEPGKVAGGIDVALKDSRDLTITGRPEWRDVVQAMHRTVFVALRDYVRKYPYVMIGPLALRIQNPQTGELLLVNEQSLPTISEDQFTQLVLVAFRSGPINLQKYQANRGGYPHWHSELCPRDASCETLHRVLLYTFYLNAVPEAGETEFYYQQRKIRPQPGTLLLAPAFFTHTHRGNTPIGGDKYIATSWILFNRAERLYGPQG